MQGIIFDIQRLCVQDGPGIRTTVFFKGCPLSCLWCHNPESISTGPQLIFRAHKCMGCGACCGVCPSGAQRFDGSRRIDFDLCRLCRRCCAVCCYDALEILGKSMTVSQVLQSVQVDRPYFGATGGVTLSGGEPMAQFPFALALAGQLKVEGFHVAMETCGFASKAHFRQIAPFVDLFLFDYKATGVGEYLRLTGVGQAAILENLHLLGALGKEIILRCPMIPGCNDSRQHFEAIAELSRSVAGIREVHILPYHRVGETKRRQLGKAEVLPDITPPDAALRVQWLRTLRELGCEGKII